MRNLIEHIENDSSELQLWENYKDNQKEMEIVVNGVFIMASYNNLSSELLISNSIKELEKEDNLDVLIGGLGMGFTAKEACKFQEIDNIDVVEIEPTIVDWNKEYFTSFNKNCLEDDRVEVIVDDFHDYVIKTDKEYDIISMDIDNGPMLLANEGNERVYNKSFFKEIESTLKPGGLYAVWSCNYDEELEKEMNKMFSNCWVEEIEEEHFGKTLPYFIYYGYRDAIYG